MLQHLEDNHHADDHTGRREWRIGTTRRNRTDRHAVSFVNTSTSGNPGYATTVSATGAAPNIAAHPRSSPRSSGGALIRLRPQGSVLLVTVAERIKGFQLIE